MAPYVPGVFSNSSYVLPMRNSSLTICAYLLLGTRHVSDMCEGNVMIEYPEGTPPMTTGTEMVLVIYSSTGMTMVTLSGIMRVPSMGCMCALMYVVSVMSCATISSVYISLMRLICAAFPYMVTLSGVA